MHFAYVDESGAPSAGDGNRYFAVAVLILPAPRAIELHIRRARRSLHRRMPSAELKAAQSAPVVISKLLEAIGSEPCEICAVIVDKRGVKDHQAEIIQDRVMAEEPIRGKKIAALPGGR